MASAIQAQTVLTPNSQDLIVGQRQSGAPLDNGYHTDPSQSIGVGVTGSAGARYNRNTVIGFQLPTLPAGHTIDTASFRITISSNNASNAPKPVALYGLSVANPDNTGTMLFATDTVPGKLANAGHELISATFSSTGSSSGTPQEDVSDFIRAFYTSHVPHQSEAFFRLCPTEDTWTNVNRLDFSKGSARLEITTTPGPEVLHRQIGSDPTFQQLIDSGVIVPGSANFPSTGPVYGSAVNVNNALLEQQTGSQPGIPSGIRMHNQVNSSVLQSNFPNFTRWYQEDGNVQVMRLFEGEQNVRNGIGPDGSPGRIEVFFPPFTIQQETWSVWEGTYTIIEPLGCNIFQLFHEGGQLWAFHLRMTSTGNITFNRRQEISGLPRNITIATDMVGKSISFMVRGNGRDYELYKRIPNVEPNWQLVTTGHYQAAVDDQISYRWGMYVGSQQGQSVSKDGVIFVTGARRYSVAAPGGEPPPPPPPEPVTYYWDNNGASAGFGTAAGVWGAPTTGNASQGWSTDATGETMPLNVTTNTVDTLHFGTDVSGRGLGTGTINVNDTVAAGNIRFGSQSGNITLDGGGIAMDGNRTVNVAGTGKTHAIHSDLLGTGGLTIAGGSTLSLTGPNTFPGPLIIGNNSGGLRLRINSIANANGTPSAAGAPTNSTNGIIQIGAVSNGSTLELAGSSSAQSTNRQVRIGSDGTGSGGATIQNNNADPEHSLTFTNSAFNVAATDTASFNRTLTLGGSNAGGNLIQGVIRNNIGGTGGRVALSKSGGGTWILTGNNTYTGNTSIGGGLLQIGNGGNTGSLGNNSNTIISAGAELRINRTDQFGYQYTGILSGSGTVHIPPGGNRFDLLDTDQTSSGNLTFHVDGRLAIRTLSGIESVHIGELTGSGEVQRGGNPGGFATLVIGGKNTDSTFHGEIKTNELGVEKTGTGTLTLTSPDIDYTGPTTVSQGTLALVGAGIASPVTVASGASLGFTIDSPATSSSSVNLANGTVKVAGDVTPGTDHLLLTATGGISGTPVLHTPIPDYELEVRDGGNTLFLAFIGPPPSSYAAWAAANADGQGPDEDFDGDGVPNGIEFFLNAAPGFTALPVLDATGTITWTNGGNIPASAYGNQFVVQTSDDLVGWNDVPAGELSANTDGPDGLLSYTLSGPAPRFVRLKVTPE